LALFESIALMFRVGHRVEPTGASIQVRLFIQGCCFELLLENQEGEDTTLCTEKTEPVELLQ